MNIFASLLLGHLIADFPLQTTSVFQWKVKSLQGVTFHVGVHLVVNAILFAPSLPAVWPALLLLLVIHAAQDRLKVRWGGEKINTPAPFVIDQIFHLFFLAAVALSPLMDKGVHTLLPASIALAASGAVLATFAWTIFVYTLARSLPSERHDLCLSLRRKIMDFSLHGPIFGAVLLGSSWYWLAVLTMIVKGWLWRRGLGGPYYSAALELGISPLWAVLVACMVRSTTGF